jgi:6,7-dimethyl-8-ribityllumazine synthase
MTDTLKIAFIKANWHAEIVDQVLKGFEADMAATGRKVAISTYDVPGAFEMPLLAKKLGERRHLPA